MHLGEVGFQFLQLISEESLELLIRVETEICQKDLISAMLRKMLAKSSSLRKYINMDVNLSY